MSIARDVLLGVVVSVPWVVLPLVVLRRQRAARTLADYDDAVSPSHVVVRNAKESADVPRVSIILPARNEAAHIAKCVASLRATAWPDVEIIVVNDHSTDGTRELAMEAARGDARVRVIDAPELPDGWFGKQWACHNGALVASGSLLLFTDADTRHAPDLLPRLVHARAERRADLISVAGSQEMRSFWEYAIQPAVFAILLARYGGTGQLENAKRSVDVIANGQCLMMTRGAYDTVGGHEAVRATVAEDLMLAQRTHSMGLRVSMVLGLSQLSTHMYSGLGAIVRGWMKNVYAGGRLAMWGGRAGRVVFPLALVGAPLALALPFFVLAFDVVRVAFEFGASATTVTWSVVASAALVVFFVALNSLTKSIGWRIVFVPIGALAFACICLAAVVRGQSVEWKGRRYRAS